MTDDKPFEPPADDPYAHPFGEPVPGEAVESTFGNPTAGYREKSRWRRSASGKPFRVGLDGRPMGRDE